MQNSQPVRGLTFLSGGEAADKAQASKPHVDDTHLLDAYSQAVVNVVEAVSPAVISVTGRGEERAQGSGSGFLLTPDGYAVTNSHVVGGRRRLLAETSDGDRVDAEVIGNDPATDIALLRLASRDLPYAELGNSSGLRVGQLVIAMGSPLGLQSTVSTGVVSALGRSMRGQDGRLIENVVQHAAPINPGNSGGPLLDSRGRVVGVNTAIIAFAQGIGFAVPSNTAEWVVREFLSHGRVRRRQLGLSATLRRIPSGQMRALDLFSDQAVEVVEVLSGGVASAIGIRSGDLLIAINDRLVSSVDDIHRLLTLFPLNVPLELTLVRDEERVEVTIPAAG
ncbi:S1C family serine protease [Planctomicrobium piriforme]|uniref:Serine protease, S1-C subfamily, contains C-terminal PDZ domain n=1 Tax=Planctomicrobium piriforme TaxID=1576369 RepID=A0A1I3GJ81_9PLAN|nr:trypsin-like peptidase domain-containing protein [Planctomicrobium piriforme]SFI23504.1 serine protease, S1-C subfamily, contains C-terminal PDZ domain [Planctomicrobium piriforme]